VFLHFAHALLRRGGRADVFAFATRLTRLTRELAATDPDVALRLATRKAPDWEGAVHGSASVSPSSILHGHAAP
jgi:uncharacterized protein with von Willebrand factor type A (vWA) domain